MAMRVVVAAFALVALTVFLFSDGTRTMFAPTLHAPQTPATQVYSGPAYAVPTPRTGYSAQVPAGDAMGWSEVAILALVGGMVGLAASATGTKQRDVQAAYPESASALAGPIVALTVAGTSAPAPSAGAGETKADLEALANKLNPLVGFYDPLNLAEQEFWGQSNEATIGFLRHAEIKHGRVAMAGFVGFLVHANGIHFPWKMPGDEICAPGVSPVALWQNLPEVAKLQIILALGIFEAYSEYATSKSPDLAHYMSGGKPGLFPPLRAGRKDTQYEFRKGGMLTDKIGTPLMPHPVPLNLYDPYNFNKDRSEEWKQEKLAIEVNNGRLAMLGLMSFLSEGAIPGSVPFLKGLIPYSGEVNVMVPFDFNAPL